MAKLKDYIAFARSQCQPQLTDAAAEELVSSYIQMRRAGSSRKVLTFLRSLPNPLPQTHTHNTTNNPEIRT